MELNEKNLIHNLKPLARIGKPHGAKGIVKIIPINGFAKQLIGIKKFLLMENSNKLIEIELEDVREYKGNRILAQLNGYRNRTQVENFQHRILYTLET